MFFFYIWFSFYARYIIYKEYKCKTKTTEETVSTEIETVKDGMTNIISVLEDSSSNTTESSNEMYLRDKSSCMDLSIVHQIVANRTNNENNCFDENSTKSLNDCTEKEANLVGVDCLLNFKSTKKFIFSSLLLFLQLLFFL